MGKMSRGGVQVGVTGTGKPRYGKPGASKKPKKVKPFRDAYTEDEEPDGIGLQKVGLTAKGQVLLFAKAGEGSRGGHIIGHDKSGRPIYESKTGSKPPKRIVMNDWNMLVAFTNRTSSGRTPEQESESMLRADTAHARRQLDLYRDGLAYMQGLSEKEGVEGYNSIEGWRDAVRQGKENVAKWEKTLSDLEAKAGKAAGGAMIEKALRSLQKYKLVKRIGKQTKSRVS